MHISNMKLTFVFSLLTNVSSPSLVTFAGKLIAGASGSPFSSDTNCTTILGEGFGSSGTGSGIPWYTFWRLGGGNSVAMMEREEEKNIRQRVGP